MPKPAIRTPSRDSRFGAGLGGYPQTWPNLLSGPYPGIAGLADLQTRSPRFGVDSGDPGNRPQTGTQTWVPDGVLGTRFGALSAGSPNLSESARKVPKLTLQKVTCFPLEEKVSTFGGASLSTFRTLPESVRKVLKLDPPRQGVRGALSEHFPGLAGKCSKVLKLAPLDPLQK